MIKTNEFLLISKPSTAPLQMLIKFRDCKNELRERQPYGCSLPHAGAEKREGKKIQREAERQSADKPHQSDNR